jgi:hypothetical protein
MKIWIQDTISPTHRNIKLHCEEHSGYKYLGDLNDDEIQEFILNIKNDLDAQKNLKLLKYYGYLHLFVVTKT